MSTGLGPQVGCDLDSKYTPKVSGGKQGMSYVD